MITLSGLCYAIVALFGVATFEAGHYRLDEKKYNWDDRKGDVLFASMLAVGITFFVAPHVWILLDGYIIPVIHIKISSLWYNEGTAFLTGLSWLELLYLKKFLKEKYLKK